VAHLDTVGRSRHFEVVRLGRKTPRLIFNEQLDDRLGAYLLLDYLPQLLGRGAYDVLLTTGEESFGSTGAYFLPPRRYHWIFSFDRAGDDVVTYCYTEKPWLDALRKARFTIGHGSYSCIDDMEHLGCCGVNAGCGYHNQHSHLCYVEVDETTKMVDLFARFYAENRERHFRHDVPEPGSRPVKYRARPFWGYGGCEWCGAPVEAGRDLCPACADGFEVDGPCDLCGEWDELDEWEGYQICEVCRKEMAKYEKEKGKRGAGAKQAKRRNSA
jgi:hypothetical protein